MFSETVLSINIHKNPFSENTSIFPYSQIKQNGQRTYKSNTEARSCTHCYHGKVISITYSQCVSVALFIKNATRVRRILLSSVAYPVLLYFSTLSHKRHDFRIESY